MFELIETSPPVDIQESEYQRLLGYPKNRPLEDRALELANMAREWYRASGRPWIYAHETGALDFREGKVWVGATGFSSRRLHDVFVEAQAHSVVLVAVSAGPECEAQAQKLWEEGKPDEYFFLKIFGSAVVEHLVTVASGRICGEADANKMAVLPHQSPGYTGWHIADQSRLWSLFQQNAKSGFPGELEVMESGMLRPEKSLLAVFGLTRDLEKARQFARLIPCQDCSLPNCRYRRAAYKRPQSKSGWQ